MIEKKEAATMDGNNLKQMHPKDNELSEFSLADFEAETDKLISDLNESKGLFLIKSANKWMQEASSRPIPKMLFDAFWFQGEVCILFADTNLGKSILAVQIGEAISKGVAINGFRNEAEKQAVLYYDFELSDKQFENRYSINYTKHHYFDDNFKRIEINPDATVPDGSTFEDYLNFSLEKSIKETGAKVLIIDNLTYLKNETEKAKDALPLMKHLKALKSKYNLSILALAHTPKRDLNKPINRNDLQGSKMLINFTDSCFAIGESHNDKHLRYLKQIKARNTEILYDTENVVLCQIEKPENFLGFEFLGYGAERQHLKELSSNDREKNISEAKELRSQGFTQRQIATQLGISLGAVNKYLKM